jgi:hypothetical protein
MILFLSTLFLIFRGERRWEHRLPDAAALAAAASSAATAERDWNPASFLQVSAQVEATPAAIRNCLLPISF